MEKLSDQEYEKLRSIIFSGEELEVRLRAQVLVFYEKGFRLDQIKNIVEKSIEEIENLLNYVIFFGIDNYLRVSYEDLKFKVNEEVFRREKEKARQYQRSIFYYIFWPITSIFYTLIYLKSFILAFIAWIYIRIIRLFSSLQLPSKNSNIATFEKGASHNYLIQINRLIVNEKDQKESIQVDKFVANSQWQLQDKIEEIIESGENITFNNPTVDSLIERGRKKDENGLFDKTRAQFYAALIVSFLVYSSSFKGGVWTITVFGMAIMISVKTCAPSHSNLALGNDLINSDTTAVISSIPSQQIDSIRNKIASNKDVEIYDYNAYFKIIGDFYDHDHFCDALSAIGEKQNNFIYEYDKIDHKSQGYYVNVPDQKYYVHVVSYKDIRQAAFQMHYLNSKEIFESKILRVFINGSILYAVVIGAFNGTEIQEICELVEKWEVYCLNNEAEIGCYFNG